ncbi:MAG: DUF2059 domain-containing protein [Pseudomonadota bacterium]|nr:DUF2059 domain-containing protein [Pseudomonadota bacterium]
MDAFGEPLALQPLADVLIETPIAALGLPIPADAGLRPEATIGEILAQFDPHYRERLRIVLDLLSRDLGRAFAAAAPEYNRITAELYAREFSVAELDAASRFFGSPAGRTLMRESVAALSDPDFMRDLMSLVPGMIASAGPAMERIQGATAHLPPPPPDEEDAEEDADGEEDEE